MIMPSFQASGAGYKPWLDSVFQFFYFLDRPLRESGVPDCGGKLLVNIATVFLWSILAGAMTIVFQRFLLGRAAEFPVIGEPRKTREDA
jgi:hypothetical protein